jgi:hypothetical protein
MLSRQLVAQECLRPPGPGVHTAATVEDDLGPIRSQIVLFGIQGEALDGVLECGLKGVVV